MSERGTPLGGPFGGLLADFVLDTPALFGIRKLWLPLSRLWAAAGAAEGEAARFMAEVPLAGAPPLFLGARLAAFEAGKRAFLEADAAWQQALFARSGFGGELDRLTRARRRTALAQAGLRTLFGDLLATRSVAPVRFAVPTPAEVEAVYGAFETSPDAVYAPAALPAVEESLRIERDEGEEFWLRFPSTSERIPGPAYARVVAPRGVADPPSLVFGNGIMIETDFEGAVPDRALAALGQGLRVVEIESPWHGRRRAPGRYGGEPFLATAPLGPVDLFTTQAQDMAVLIDWCRRTSRGRVALGGASMGALAALLAASHAGLWPPSARPDALLLLTAAADIAALERESELVAAVGVPAALRERGWDEAQLARWQVLVQAAVRAPLPARNIVAVLGRRDRILPYATGEDLVARWGVPDENLFVSEAGHFSAQLGSLLDGRPLARLVEALRRG